MSSSTRFARTAERAQTDDKVIKQGDDGDSLYLVADGRLRVFRTLGDGKNVPLASLNEGAVVGEMAVINLGRRTATVRTETPLYYLEFRREGLFRLQRLYPRTASQLFLNVAQILGQRLAVADKMLVGLRARLRNASRYPGGTAGNATRGSLSAADRSA